MVWGRGLRVQSRIPSLQFSRLGMNLRDVARTFRFKICRGFHERTWTCATTSFRFGPPGLPKRGRPAVGDLSAMTSRSTRTSFMGAAVERRVCDIAGPGKATKSNPESTVRLRWVSRSQIEAWCRPCFPALGFRGLHHRGGALAVEVVELRI